MKVLVMGRTGSGKNRLATILSEVTGLPHTRLGLEHTFILAGERFYGIIEFSAPAQVMRVALGPDLTIFLEGGEKEEFFNDPENPDFQFAKFPDDEQLEELFIAVRKLHKTGRGLYGISAG